LNLESHIVDTIYTYHCLGCGFEEKIEGDVSFPESKTCTNCALSGMIDGAGIDPIALFEITSRAEVKSNCKACKGGVWHDGEDGFTCPSCRSKKLKSKMGALWDPSEESKQE
jgi:hypothetical protein